MSDITISLGLPDHHRRKAAELYYLAFRKKLYPIFRDKERGLRVLEQSLNPDYAFVATSDAALVGIAGIQEAKGCLVDIQPRIMTRTFGLFGGWWRLLALSLFSRTKQKNILLMDGIVVDSSMRGKGIGSQLLDVVVDYARSAGYKAVRLDVVNTNPRARTLYEHKGFVAVDTTHHPFLNRIFGFSGSTTMLKVDNKRA